MRILFCRNVCSYFNKNTSALLIIHGKSWKARGNKWKMENGKWKINDFNVIVFLK
jgi:hypothetical protein